MPPVSSCTVSCRLRRVLLALLALLVLVGVGRLGQVAWQSHYNGPREPYLQMPAPDGITLRWQSGNSEIGVVRYGLSPERLESVVREETARVSHELRLAGLTPATRYYYSVGTEEAFYRAGADYWFVTPPLAGTAQPTRIWVQGDPGWWRAEARAVRDAALAWMGEHQRPGRPLMDLWLTTGDNAYRSGKNLEFQAALFEPYKELLRNIPYVPTYGNHDARRWAFFDIFTFPTAGEAGGVASGSEHFFSFDYANIHFVFLDSEQSDRDVDGTMMQWLKRDLAANRQPWLIAAFHHPPYSKGSHNSDSARDSWGRMIEMRENFLPVLEQAGVDLVLSGHSHVYERSQLLACHYGDSSSFAPAMVVAPEVAGQPLRKPAGLAPLSGTIYAVVGSSTNLDHGPLDHPAMAVALQERGSLLLDVEAERLRGVFVTADGMVADSFVIEKNAAPTAPIECRTRLGAP